MTADDEPGELPAVDRSGAVLAALVRGLQPGPGSAGLGARRTGGSVELIRRRIQERR
jgi:hypothetical protein